MDLTEAEDIKKMWQEYTQEKIFMTQIAPATRDSTLRGRDGVSE